MMNYKTQQTGNWAPTPSVTTPGAVSGYAHMTHEVVETGTQQIIKSGLTSAQAKDLCRHLNLGGGFDGFTPAFFLANFDRTTFQINELEDDFF